MTKFRLFSGVCCLMALLPVGCGEEAGVQDGSDENADYMEYRLPHSDFLGGAFGSTLEGMEPRWGDSRTEGAPNDGWIGQKTILRQGAQLNVYCWATPAEGSVLPKISVEIYRWQEGLLGGWGDPLRSWTDTNGSTRIPRLEAIDAYLDSSFNPVSHWEVPQDGLYLIIYRTKNALDFCVRVDTDKNYWQAASCLDDPGICQRLDAEASCGNHCRETDLNGYCLGALEPEPYCNYVDAHPAHLVLNWLGIDP